MIRKFSVSDRAQQKCLALIAVTFFLTSSGYLSWLYHLLRFVNSPTADLWTMGAGYCAQVVGLGLFALMMRSGDIELSGKLFGAGAAVYIAFLVPAMLSGSLPGTIIFGLLMNAACGFLAGYYLHALAVLSEGRHRALVFGVGYAISVLLSWLLSLVGGGRFIRSWSALLFYIPVAALAVWLSSEHSLKAADKEKAPGVPGADQASSGKPAGTDRMSSEKPSETEAEKPALGGAVLQRRTLILAAVTIFGLCLVKNIGFAFPSSDLGSGFSLEFSRLLYAAGLITAGIVSDRDRRYGAFCTVAALITPFIMLSLAGESVPHMILWCLDYFIYGFFSVYRVILFSDIARQSHTLCLAGCGLLFGRLGDAAGTALYHALGGRTVPLVIAAAILFIVTFCLFTLLFQALYIPAAAQRRSEKELFEHFAIRHDLSSREREVLRHLLDGDTNSEIAQKLFVSESTVKFHVHNLLQKTGCTGRAQLKAKYTQDKEV